MNSEKLMAEQQMILKRYDLVLRDAASNIEVLRLPIKVDLAFGNDFWNLKWRNH